MEDILEVEDEAMKIIYHLSNINGFSLNLWYNGTNTDAVNSFIKKYSNRIKITSNDQQHFSFFCIENEDVIETNYRYKYVGDVMSGIRQYQKLIDHISKKENEWS